MSTPGQNRKKIGIARSHSVLSSDEDLKDDNDVDLKNMFQSYMKEQRVANGRRDAQHNQFVGTINGLKECVVSMDKAIKKETEVREHELGEVKGLLHALEKKQVVPKGVDARNEEDDDAWRDFQIVVGGFAEGTDADIIEATIKEFVEQAGVSTEDKRIFTFSDPADIGVIEFPTIKSKISFYKKIEHVAKAIGEGREMWFSNNRSFERRARDKTLGRLKHLLITKGGHLNTDVKIWWKLGTIKVKGTKVATVGDGGKVKLVADVEMLKEELLSEMNVWFDEKGAESPHEE